MKHCKIYSRWHMVPEQQRLMVPVREILPNTPPLQSRCNKPLAMDTEDLLNILTYYHLQEFSSGRELIQALQEDEYARNLIAPAGGIHRSTFFDTVNDRGVEQLLYVFTELQKKAGAILPKQHANLGDLVAIDGSFIDSVLSMHWAEYSSSSNKAKVHLGFDLNHGIPRKIFLTKGKASERLFVSTLIDPGQTGVLDRGYQAHRLFDEWRRDGRHFVCRIKGNTIREILEEFPLPENHTSSVMPRCYWAHKVSIKLNKPFGSLGISLTIKLTGSPPTVSISQQNKWRMFISSAGTLRNSLAGGRSISMSIIFLPEARMA